MTGAMAMRNIEQLSHATRADRVWLLDAPVIRRALAGNISRELYVAFLAQAYHHVRHTVPLLMAVGSRLDRRHQWLQKEIVHYLEEETGHEDWILDDIEAAGGDAEGVRDSAPAVETDAMVAYAYDVATRRAPVGFFGMVFVLEGTSAAIALGVADSLKAALALPDRAFTYLRTHGKLDLEHVGHLESIVSRLDPARDLPAVVACAQAMYWLYGNMFRGLERRLLRAGEPQPAELLA
jgi:pyrroloquinoline quinone (PQQ) biosynthesis protein C